MQLNPESSRPLDTAKRALLAALQLSSTENIMTELFDFGNTERTYWDRKNWATLDSYKHALRTSTTLYVGNLSFYTQEAQIYAVFDQVSDGK